MIDVRLASTDDKGWRFLCEHSHQASLYTEPEWLALHPVLLLLAETQGEPQAGLVVAPNLSPPNFIPYQGLLLRRYERTERDDRAPGSRFDVEAVDALLEAAEDTADPISVWNSPAVLDIRPFTWRWYKARSDWQHVVRYTYLTTDRSEPETRARSLVTGAPVVPIAVGDWFEPWSRSPWVTEEDCQLMRRIAAFPSVSAWTDGEATVVWGKDASGRGYYLASYGKPTNVLATLIRRHPSCDMVGANSPDRALFKRSFGGQLRTYYGLRRLPKPH